MLYPTELRAHSGKPSGLPIFYLNPLHARKPVPRVHCLLATAPKRRHAPRNLGAAAAVKSLFLDLFPFVRFLRTEKRLDYLHIFHRIRRPVNEFRLAPDRAAEILGLQLVLVAHRHFNHLFRHTRHPEREPVRVFRQRVHRNSDHDQTRPRHGAVRHQTHNAPA